MFHLAWFGQAGPSNWDASSSQFFDWRKPELYMDVARMCERAKMDIVFFADTLAVPTKFGGNTDWPVRKGFMFCHDPIPHLAMMGAATKHIGLGTTMSTTFWPPFLLARLLGTMDHLTSGRMQWNVVTTSSSDAAENFGLDSIIPHDERYDRADEFMQVCRSLWDSWEPDALIEDRENRIFADPSKVHAINHKGKYFNTKGPLNVVSTPQKYPVISVAGTSPRGIQFAVDHAEMVIAHLSSVEEMKAYSNRLRTALDNSGRDPNSVKIFYSICPIMGISEAMANEKWQQKYDEADSEQGLVDLSTTIGHDLSKYNIDEPLPVDMKTEAIQGKLQSVLGQGRTLRELAKREAMKETYEICGSYKHVADVLEHTWKEGDADGFHFRGVIQKIDYLTEVCTELVPILQRRGLTRTEYSGATLRENLFEF
jgi:FMN-dependent oxidoreductase (nitrilotriacetate monooxygenase family)